MKRIEFITINGHPITIKVNEIAVVLDGPGPTETSLFVIGNSSVFRIREFYVAVIKKIKEAESD